MTTESNTDFRSSEAQPSNSLGVDIDMSNKNVWVVTWQPSVSAPSQKIPLSREQKMFGSEKKAVNFAMSLEDTRRITVQMHLPGGRIAQLASIEQNKCGISKRCLRARNNAPITHG